LRSSRIRRPYVSPRRSGETAAFSAALQRLRREQEWTQPQLGARLGVSIRTLTNWECGYWLPHFKQRLHVVLSLRNVPPANVLEVADALGVSGDPLVAPMLQQFKDALEPPVEETVEEAPVVALPPPEPPPPPPPPRPSVSEVRAAVDPIVLDAANALDARPNDVRAIVAKVVAACRGMNGTLEELEGAVVAVVRKGRG
jgi:transcriptional regulator with XRE-family HTH domain